jgi:hypothetical protein
MKPISKGCSANYLFFTVFQNALSTLAPVN